MRREGRWLGGRSMEGSPTKPAAEVSPASSRYARVESRGPLTGGGRRVRALRRRARGTPRDGPHDPSIQAARLEGGAGGEERSPAAAAANTPLPHPSWHQRAVVGGRAGPPPCSGGRDAAQRRTPAAARCARAARRAAAGRRRSNRRFSRPCARTHPGVPTRLLLSAPASSASAHRRTSSHQQSTPRLPPPPVVYPPPLRTHW